MANLNFKISFDLGAAFDITGIVNRQVFPLLNQTVRAIAQQTASDWQKEVHQAKLWAGEKDAYAKSIDWKMTGDFSAVIEATYDKAAEIEEGRPSRDLKRMLDTSSKVRRTEDGRRFLVIPMRHNMAKLQSAGLYDMASALAPSKIVGQTKRDSGEVTKLSPTSGMSKSANQTGFLSNPKTRAASQVNQNIYAWGQKLSKGAMKGAGVDAGTRKWAQGMHRFDTSTPGGGKSSTFLTFRIMIEGSAGWVVPAQPGLHLARKVTDAMQPKANAAFAGAINAALSKG